ncbi:MAG: response regulator [Candidatus Izemoplasmataceae bacterium]
MKILLVDDDQMILDSLNVLLSKEKSFTIIGTATNGLNAINFLKRHQPDIILMDIRMPKMDGIEATMHIKKNYPKVKIIMLTTFKDFKHIHQALHAGASGYMLKSDEVSVQIKTINNVYQGQAVLSLEVLDSLTKTTTDEVLTDRENSCLELIAQGYSNKEIAQRLFISEGTVRNVISIILDKLNLRDRTQIAIYYWQKKGVSE